MSRKRKNEVFRVPSIEGHWSPDSVRAETELKKAYEQAGVRYEERSRDEPVSPEGGLNDVPWWGWVLAIAFFVFICVVPMLTLSTERLNGVPGG